MANKKCVWEVRVAGFAVKVLATSYNNACHKAFRALIQAGHIKAKPKTVSGRFWGTDCTLLADRVSAPKEREEHVSTDQTSG